MADEDTLNKQLWSTIHFMKQEGLVNGHFIFVCSLKENNNGDPSFLADLISVFCSEAQDVIKDLTQTLNEPTLNYDLLRKYLYKIKGSALCIGAGRLAQSFACFEDAIDKESKEECLRALKGSKQEYSLLEAKLHVVLQQERKIVTLSTR